MGRGGAEARAAFHRRWRTLDGAENFSRRKVVRPGPDPRPGHSRRRSSAGVPRGAAHGRHLRHHRGARGRGFRPGDPAWCNLGQGQPETGPLPGRAAARSRRSVIDPTTTSTRRSPASGSCARRSPRSTTGSTGAACPRSTPPRTSAISGGGRAALTRGGGLARPDQPRALPARLHRVRGAARHLQGVHRRSRSCSRASAATRFSADDLRREVLGPRPVGAAAVEPVQPHRQAGRGARARRAGSASAASSTARCSSTSSTRTTSGARAPERRARWRAPRATSRTSTAIRW